MKVQKGELYNKNIFIFILYAIFFSTVFFNNHSLLWLTIKSYYYFYAVASFLFLYKIFFNSDVTIRINFIDVAFFLYLVFVVINSLSNSLSFWEDDIFIANVILGILYFVFKNSISDRELFWNISSGLVLFAVIASIYGIFEELYFYSKNGLLDSINGPFSNSGPFAGYLISVIPLTVGLYYRTKLTKIKQARYLYLSALILELLALLFSESRAGFLGLFIAVLFWLIHIQKSTVYKFWYFFRRNIGKLILMSSIGIVAIYSLLYYKIDSVLGRILIWKISWKIFEDSWLFGTGFGRFSKHYLDYQSRYFRDSTFAQEGQFADNTYYAFNDLLQIGVESGMIGLLLFLIIFLLVFFNRTVSENNVPNVLLISVKSSLLAIIGFGLFSYPLSSLPTQLNFIFFLAMTSSFSPTILKLCLNQKQKKTFALIFIIIIGLFGADQYRKFTFVIRWENIGDNLSLSEKEILFSFEQIYPILKYRGDFLFNYGARLSEMGHHQKAILMLNEAREKTNHTDLHIFMGNSYSALNDNLKAEESYLFASNMIPNKLYPKYLLLVHYKSKAQWCMAFYQAKNILNTRVKVPSFFANEILLKTREFIKQYDDKKCLENH